jgi:hypothetical protein
MYIWVRSQEGQLPIVKVKNGMCHLARIRAVCDSRLEAKLYKQVIKRSTEFEDFWCHILVKVSYNDSKAFSDYFLVGRRQKAAKNITWGAETIIYQSSFYFKLKSQSVK